MLILRMIFGCLLKLIRNLLFHLGCRSSGKCYNQNLINIDFLLCLIAICINSHDHLKNPFYKDSRLTGACRSRYQKITMSGIND